MRNTASSGMLMLGILIGILVVWAGETRGIWISPLVATFLWAVWAKRTAWQYAGAAVIAVVGYAIPLAVAARSFPVGKAADTVAAIMGFGHQGIIVWAFTFLLAMMQAAAGAWVGHALKSSVHAPAPRYSRPYRDW